MSPPPPDNLPVIEDDLTPMEREDAQRDRNARYVSLAPCEPPSSSVARLDHARRSLSLARNVGPVLLVDAFRQFLAECRNGTLRNRSTRTLQNYRAVLAVLVRLTGVRFVSEIQLPLLRQFFHQGTRERQWTPNTVSSYQKSLAPFLVWCVRQGLLHDNPMAALPAPRLLRRQPEYYSEEQIRKILTSIEFLGATDFERFRDRAIVATLLLAGIRTGELLGLRTTDVDFKTEIIRIRAETAKDREDRAIKMNLRLASTLREYAEARNGIHPRTSAFWVTRQTRRAFTRHGFKHLIERLSKDLGFRFRPHKMRHTFATRFYQGSKDLVSLQQILGHNDVKTTLIYTHAIPEETKASLEQNPLNNFF